MIIIQVRTNKYIDKYEGTKTILGPYARVQEQLHGLHNNDHNMQHAMYLLSFLLQLLLVFSNFHLSACLQEHCIDLNG